MADIGIELEIRSYEWGTFFADIRSGNFQLYSLAWVGIADPDIYRIVFHSRMTPPNGNNRGRFRDAQLDRLTERARRLAQPARIPVYHRVQRRVARRLPYVSLWWPRQVVVSDTRLQHFTMEPSGDLFSLATARLR